MRCAVFLAACLALGCMQALAEEPPAPPRHAARWYETRGLSAARSVRFDLTPSASAALQAVVPSPGDRARRRLTLAGGEGSWVMRVEGLATLPGLVGALTGAESGAAWSFERAVPLTRRGPRLVGGGFVVDLPLPDASAPAGRVAITPRGLSVDGRVRFLYGADVHYFRIRDRGGDAARTHAMWAATLDKALAAGMNFVSTYVPWDVHEPAEGKFDFRGAADLQRFLELCQERDLLVMLKPGPFINAEWPYGMGSFGAVPEWFKRGHPGALARGPDGRPSSCDPLGRWFGSQPTFLAPELLTATERYFARLAPIFREFIRRGTVLGVQIDNETNFFYGDRYSSDYSVHGVAQYRAFLRARYGTIEALDQAYGTSHADFELVTPPTARPRRSAPPAENLRHQDWFDAGHAGIEAYHRALRAIWERLGVREPDILFVTNDSPHAFVGRDLIHWRGGEKNAAGLAMLDAYPKQFPTSGGRPFDYPFLTPYFSKRFAASNGGYAFAGGSPTGGGRCYAAEIEGGLFSVPFLNVALPVPLQTTDLALLQHIGRGSALASVYVLQGGLNRDDSPYFTNAALGVDGREQPRYEVLRRWGRFLGRCGDELLASEAVGSRVALAVDERFDAPAGGIPGHPGKLQVDEASGLFGLLEDAGLDPAVVELSRARPGDLDPFGVVWFVNPDVVHDGVAALLDDWVRRGGTLVNVLHTGRFDQRWRRGTSTERLLADGLFGDGSPVRSFERNLFTSGSVEVRAPGGAAGPFKAGPFLLMYRLADGATPLVWSRGLPFGLAREVAGWSARRGAGTAVHLGTNPGAAYAGSGYYDAPAKELERARELVRGLAASARIRPVVSVRGAAGTAWARRVQGGPTFVFVCNRRGEPATLTVELHDPAALGIQPDRIYEVEDALGERTIAPEVRGGDLVRTGVQVELPAWGAAVLRVR
jgi:hypothetical protein